jgi:hypothetical protein
MKQEPNDGHHRRSRWRRLWSSHVLPQRSWEVRTKILITWVRTTCEAAADRSRMGSQDAKHEVNEQLGLAESYLEQRATLLTWWRGTRVEGATGHARAATVSMIHVVDDEQLVGISARLLTVIDHYLSPTCPERRAIRSWVDSLESQDQPRRTNLLRRRRKPATVSTQTRDELAVALQAAYDNAAANDHRLHRFQGMLIGGALVLLALVLLLTLIGWREPDVIPLCFPDPDAPTDVTATESKSDTATVDGTPEVEETVVCPSSDSPTVATVNQATSDGAAIQSAPPNASERASGADVATVVLFGFVGAALTSVVFVTHQAPPTSVPVSSIRVFQAVLKGATGMLTAVLGLLFLRAGVVPGFTRIDTRSQILVYAVVFGAAQHLVTRLIDARSDVLVSAVTVTPTGEPADGRPSRSSGDQIT